VGELGHQEGEAQQDVDNVVGVAQLPQVSLHPLR